MRARTRLLLLCLSAYLAGIGPAAAAQSLFDAFKDGSVDFSMRYRYENVDDDAGNPRDAEAGTLRTTLGYETGMFHAFNAYIQFEDIREPGPDNFNSPADPDPRYDTVADPIQTSVLQGYLGYAGIPDTQLKLGRQIITYRDAPFHRFIGTVAWRQHWQTFDAFSLQNTSLPDTRLSYAYIWRVNRIFGSDAPDPLDNFDSNSHLFNARYNGLSNMTLQAYSYLLDFDNADAFSTQTYGGRVEGHYPFTPAVKGLYAAEYARQSDYADNPASIDADYFFGELGLSWSLPGPVDSITAKMSYELQEGSGGADRFVTILGTNHPFQGWADRFLVTPGDGVEDIYGTVILAAFDARLMAVYHDFSSDNDSYDYGTEFDILATKTFRKHYTIGAKYASYDGDNNATNSVRNPALAADVDKFWLFAQFKY